MSISTANLCLAARRRRRREAIPDLLKNMSRLNLRAIIHQLELENFRLHIAVEHAAEELQAGRARERFYLQKLAATIHREDGSRF